MLPKKIDLKLWFVLSFEMCRGKKTFFKTIRKIRFFWITKHLKMKYTTDGVNCWFFWVPNNRKILINSIFRDHRLISYFLNERYLYGINFSNFLRMFLKSQKLKKNEESRLDYALDKYPFSRSDSVLVFLWVDPLYKNPELSVFQAHTKTNKFSLFLTQKGQHWATGLKDIFRVFS